MKNITPPAEPQPRKVEIDQPLATRPQTQMPALNIEALFDKAVSAEKGVEVLERLMVVRRELRAESAKEAFDRALAAFQSECPPLVKDRGVPDRNGKIAYKYSPFESVIAHVKPYMEKHGFSFTLDTDLESAVGWVIAKCKLTHNAGHSEMSTAKFPLGTKTQIMSDTQVYAAALTFASRRVFCNALGIVTAGEDADGRGQEPKPAGPSNLGSDKANVEELTLKKKLVDLTRSVHSIARGYALDDIAKSKLTQYLIDEAVISDTETVGDLSGTRLKDVVAKVEAKRRGRS